MSTTCCTPRNTQCTDSCVFFFFLILANWQTINLTTGIPCGDVNRVRNGKAKPTLDVIFRTLPRPNTYRIISIRIVVCFTFPLLVHSPAHLSARTRPESHGLQLSGPYEQTRKCLLPLVFERESERTKLTCPPHFPQYSGGC